MKERGLGRKHASDRRDEGHLAAPRVFGVPLTGWKYWFDNGVWLDQGNTGTCVGHEGVVFLEDSPTTHPLKGFDAFEFYRECLNIDEWLENDWTIEGEVDYDFGTSIRAMGKVLQARGHLTEYLWAWDLNTAVRWLLEKGPIMVGTTWWRSMFDTRREKDALGRERDFVVLDESSGVAGGHAYAWNGVNVEAQTIRVKLGSWGRDYGVDGRASLHFRDAQKLIEDDGECLMTTEVKI